jgi:hypothetical protein
VVHILNRSPSLYPSYTLLSEQMLSDTFIAHLVGTKFDCAQVLTLKLSGMLAIVVSAGRYWELMHVFIINNPSHNDVFALPGKLQWRLLLI